MHTKIRRALEATLTITLSSAVLAGLVLAGAATTSRDTGPAEPDQRSTRPVSLGAATATDPAKAGAARLVVAVVVGQSGTVAADLLAPYDIFASSPAFTTYVVAATDRPAPLEGGPSLIPTHTFADVDADPSLTPDLVVVPAVTDPTGAVEAPLRAWVTEQWRHGAKVLGVCAGARVLAATGMLDGHRATSHWSRISALEASNPAVHWVRGQLYVQDGSITTTAAVTSGIPGALRLVADLAGPAEAERVATLHSERGWSMTSDTAIPDDGFAPGDWPVGLNAVMPWFRPTVGVALVDGVGELDAAAAFEVYTQSAAARTVALAQGDVVRTRHGLALQTTSLDQVGHLTRVVVPGADTLDAVDPRLRQWARTRHLSVDLLNGASGTGDRGDAGGFAAALEGLATHTDTRTAVSTAKMIGYPTSHLTLPAERLPLRTLLLALGCIAVAILIGRTPSALLRRRRRLVTAGQ